MIYCWISNSEAETEKIGCEIASQLREGTYLLLEGDLGAGKTTFVKGLAQGLKVSNEVLVHSPTFTLVNEYPGKIPLIHVDLYRLNHVRELEELNLEEYFDQNAIIAVEWYDRFLNVWPTSSAKVSIQLVKDSKQRQITLTKN